MSAPKGVALHRYPPRRDTSWMVDANCSGLDSELFFLSQGQRIPDVVKRVCETCPVQLDCLEHAIATGADGVWGGCGEHDRRRIARGLRSTA